MCDDSKNLHDFSLAAFCMVSTAHTDVLASHVDISQYAANCESRKCSSLLNVRSLIPISGLRLFNVVIFPFTQRISSQLRCNGGGIVAESPAPTDCLYGLSPSVIGHFNINVSRTPQSGLVFLCTL
jgi:hypothetical protein